MVKRVTYVDLQSSGYCRSGLGVGSPECTCNLPQSEKKILNGGPDIASELLKDETPSEPGLHLLIPDSVNSLEKLSRFIIESGFSRNTPEYMELYSKYRANFKSECPYL